MTIENAFIECSVFSTCPVHPGFLVNALPRQKSLHFKKLVVQITLAIHDPSGVDGKRDGQLQRVITFIPR